VLDFDYIIPFVPVLAYIHCTLLQL